MAETVALKIKVDTGGSEKTLGQLESRAGELNEEMRKVPLGSKAFKVLKKELIGVNKEIKNTELSMESLDNEQVASELGSVAGAVGDMTAAFVLLGGSGGALEETAQTISKALGISMAFKGAIEGFSSAKKLFNNIIKQSNVLQKVNLFITRATIIAQKALGFSTDVTTKSFKLMRGALIATGIGALVVGIGLLIANFDKLKKLLSSTTKEQEAYNKVTETAIENTAKELSAADKLGKVLKDEKISREDKVKAVKELQLEYPGLLSNVDAEKTAIEDINKALELNVKLLVLKAKQEAIAELRAEEFKKQISETTKMQSGQNVGLMDTITGWQLWLTGLGDVVDAQDLANLQSKHSINLSEEIVDGLDNVEKGIQAEIDALKEEGAVYDKNGDAGKKEADDKLKRQEAWKKLRNEQAKLEKQAIYDLALAQKQASAEEIIDAEAKTKALIKIEKFKLEQQLKDKKLTDTQIKLLEFKTQEAIDKIQEGFTQKEIDRKKDLLAEEIKLEEAQWQLLQEITNTEQEFELLNLAQQYDEKFALAVGNAELEKALKEQHETDIKAIEDKFRDAKKEVDKDTKKQDLLDAQEVKAAKIQSAIDSIGAIINLTSAFAKDNEKSQRRAFEINKKLQIAQALIQTYQGVQAIFATSAANPLSIPFPAYPYIQAAIALTTGLANIQNIRKQQFSGGSAGGSFGGGGGGGGGGAAAPQIAPVTNTSTLVPQDAQQVYVTETDITNTQNKVSVIEAQSTF